MKVLTQLLILFFLINFFEFLNGNSLCEVYRSGKRKRRSLVETNNSSSQQTAKSKSDLIKNFYAELKKKAAVEQTGGNVNVSAKYRVAGGLVASLYVFKSLVFMSDALKIQYCSGSIINKNTILTAGHCVCHLNGEQKLNNIFVGYDGKNECKTAGIKSIHMPLIYEYSSCELAKIGEPPGVNSFDFAIIKLKSDIPELSTARYAKLSFVNPETIPMDELLVFAGYGGDLKNQYDRHYLQFGSATRIKCKLRGDEKAICVSALGEQKPNKGDSGGPVYRYNKMGDFEQIGVVSGSLRFEGQNQIVFPSLYHHKEFIQKYSN